MAMEVGRAERKEKSLLDLPVLPQAMAVRRNSAAGVSVA